MKSYLRLKVCNPFPFTYSLKIRFHSFLYCIVLYCIVDAVTLMRKQSFGDMRISERDTPRIVIPDYTILVTKIRYAIRKQEYLSNPLQERAAFSIDGNEIHESISSVFEMSHQSRKDDILKGVQFNDFIEGYSSKKGKIPVLKDEKLNKPDEKEIDTQLLVLIECIEDSDLKEQCKIYNSSLNKSDIMAKELFLSNLLDNKYEF